MDEVNKTGLSMKNFECIKFRIVSQCANYVVCVVTYHAVIPSGLTEKSLKKSGSASISSFTWKDVSKTSNPRVR